MILLPVSDARASQDDGKKRLPAGSGHLIRRSRVPVWSDGAVVGMQQVGLPLTVPRDARGLPITRYQFVRMLDRALRKAHREAFAEGEAERKRFQADPNYRWVPPTRAENYGTMARWLSEELKPFVSATSPPGRCDAGEPILARVDGDLKRVGLDIPNCHPDRGAVRQMCQRGIFTGFPDGTFRGDQPLTLGEYAVGIHRIVWEYLRQFSCPPTILRRSSVAGPSA